ncbi:FecR family protein [Niastella sp. OAS944]|uniref:FecR family protein n=1 Tax=Niastella sp. OAS944 TaxID=2664089 RepID=UPI003487BD85|nr:ferric-dicitrate binding protein FerR (iron transport regulator) [Chitinophagaceae bacterium OAS944]
MQHKYRTVEDLLKEESFINYCLRKNEQDVHYWEKYLAENPGKKELIAEAVQEYRLLFTALAQADFEEQLSALKKKLAGSDSAPVIELNTASRARTPFYRRFSSIAVAAMAVLVIGFYFIRKIPPTPTSQNRSVQYTCKPGERKSFQFPDGTQVILNAGSEIYLNDQYAKNTREVFLKGEAFFEVQHNAEVPFIVHTASMDVKALGTAFNVKSYNNEGRTEAVLVRGLVEVTLKKDNNRKLLLHPDEKVMWRDDKAGSEAEASHPAANSTAVVKPVKKNDNGDVKEIAWVQNNLAFEDEAFEEIAYQLNRWYNVNIQFESSDIKQYHFTATFKREKIEQVLEILRASKRFNYRIEGEGSIVVYR